MFGSCPHVPEDSSEVCSVERDRMHQGKECDFNSKEFHGEKAGLYRGKLWAREYYVWTLGLEEESVRVCIRQQGADDARLNQLNLVQGEKSPSGGSSADPLGGLTELRPRLRWR